MDSFIKFSFHNSSLPDTSIGVDLIQDHSIELLSLGCYYLNFRDAIKEGDGERVLRCWRYMLPIFISTRRKNYAKEALLLISQHDYLLPHRMAQQVIWSRFVNIRGVPGGNIPADLHNEHLNKICKEAVRALGSNKTEESVIRVGKALGTIIPILSQFDEDNGISLPVGRHSEASINKDRDLIIGDLMKNHVFEFHKDRSLCGLPKPKSLITNMSENDLHKWIKKHLK